MSLAAPLLDEPVFGHADGGVQLGSNDDVGGPVGRSLGFQLPVPQLPHTASDGSW